MTQTYATQKQAEAIKQRMAEIRTALPYRADAARAQASQLKAKATQLTDWKYHLSRHPLPILAAVVVAGYVIVPHKPHVHAAGQTGSPSNGSTSLGCSTESSTNGYHPPAKRGLLGGIVGAVATIALKQVSTLATHQISQLLSKRVSQ